MMRSPELQSIGIIGVGDLGSQLAVQIGSVATDLHLFDPKVNLLPAETKGVDQVTLQDEMRVAPTWHKTAAEVLERATLVHWCAPLDKLEDVEMQNEQMLVLHDSVMARSRAAKERLGSPCRVSIVHLLMNKFARVVVSADSDSLDEIENHLLTIGLKPVQMETDEHDMNMAVSQAPMAILHEVLGEKLATLRDSGLLTPSGEDLAEALQDRAVKWTDVTLSAILGNPKIPDLIDKMAEQIVSPK